MQSHAARLVVIPVLMLGLVVLAACGGSSGARPPATAPASPPAAGPAPSSHPLQGEWRLVTYEAIAADGSRTRQPVTGRMSVGPAGNLQLNAQVTRQGQEPFVLDYSGRAVVDQRAQMLRVEGANVPAPPGGAPANLTAAVSLDRSRHYQLSGDLLTVTAIESGTARPVATAVWRRQP